MRKYVMQYLLFYLKRRVSGKAKIVYVNWKKKILKINQGPTRGGNGGSTCVDKKPSSSPGTCEHSNGHFATELKVLFRTNSGFVTITADGASLLD